MCGIGDAWIKENGDAEYASEVPEKAENAGLIIFVKNPEKGKVKTRLAKTIGDEKALEAYLFMLEHTREVALKSSGGNFLFYSSFVDEEDAWPAAHFSKQLQISGDLGKKMTHAFSQVFAAGKEKVVIIGSDCLDLRVHHVNKAIKALDQHDFVIGPAEDGGYYLIGMRNFSPEVFSNIEWSTETVFSDTMRNVEQLKGTVHLLEKLSDVDFEADLARAMENRTKKIKQNTFIETNKHEHGLH